MLQVFFVASVLSTVDSKCCETTMRRDAMWTRHSHGDANSTTNDITVARAAESQIGDGQLFKQYLHHPTALLDTLMVWQDGMAGTAWLAGYSIRVGGR